VRALGANTYPTRRSLSVSFGASTQQVGAVTAARAFGSLLGTLPAGKCVQQLGVRAAVLYGAAAYVVACAWGGISTGVLSLFASRCLAGCAYSLFSIGQQTMVRLVVPKQFRGRILSTVGGSFRIGSFAAPLFGGGLAQDVGFRSVFLLQSVVSAASLPFVHRCMPDSRPEPPPALADGSRPPAETLAQFVARNRSSVASAWTATLLLSLARSARDLALPLGAVKLGLNRRGAGWLVAVSYLFDVLFFPLGGYIMDSRGCWIAGAASGCVMALGFWLLAAALGGGAHATRSLYASGAVLGTGNGTSGAPARWSVRASPKNSIASSFQGSAVAS